LLNGKIEKLMKR